MFASPETIQKRALAQMAADQKPEITTPVQNERQRKTELIDTMAKARNEQERIKALKHNAISEPV